MKGREGLVHTICNAEGCNEEEGEEPGFGHFCYDDGGGVAVKVRSWSWKWDGFVDVGCGLRVSCDSVVEK